jgi:membrane-associated phospholipid phosphatase
MKNIILLILSFSLMLPGYITGQTDTTKAFTNAPNVNLAKEQEKYKTRLLPSMVVPAILIGYGLTTIKNHGLYSSYAMHRDLKGAIKSFGKTSIKSLDNIMIIAPYIELGILNIFKIKCKNDWLNTSLLFLKSELIMAAIVFPMKSLTSQMRPYAYDSLLAGHPLNKTDHPNAFQSLPSGHTAQAFVAASIVHKEYRSKSVWYGVGAYTIATGVAAFRMLNNKHWQSDVIVGAGIGLLSVHIAYATHKFRWGRKEICLLPSINRNEKGFVMACNF